MFVKPGEWSRNLIHFVTDKALVTRASLSAVEKFPQVPALDYPPPFDNKISVNNLPKTPLHSFILKSRVGRCEEVNNAEEGFFVVEELSKKSNEEGIQEIPLKLF